MHHPDLSEGLCHTIATWLGEKVTSRNNRALEQVWKLLPGIPVLRALKDDLTFIFNRISKLLIGVKAVKLLY